MSTKYKKSFYLHSIKQQYQINRPIYLPTIQSRSISYLWAMIPIPHRMPHKNQECDKTHQQSGI